MNVVPFDAFDTSVEVSDGEQTDESPFDAFSSDVQTHLAHAPRVKAPSSSSPGSTSSDPPTRFLRGIAEHVDIPVGSLVDEHEIEAKLGEGAMGIVYRARHLTLGRQVALKVVAPTMGADPQAIGRFAREARALATLHHPNIVNVHSFGELPDGRSYYSMEYLEGVTLYERLQRGRVPLDEALAILDQMASALEVAHAAGIVHRDLKPENTFLARLEHGQSSIVKLLDFGLSKLAVADGVEKTASGAVIGTCLYISPEQARGPDVDGRTDVYALGVIGYELIVGQHPFPNARTATAALAAHLAETPPQPRTIWPEIPAELDALLPSLLSKNSNYRPTLPDVRDVITSVLSGTSQARATTAPAVRSARDTRAWLGSLVVLALIIGIVIGARVLGGTSNQGAARPDAVEIVATPRADTIDATEAIDAGAIPSVTDRAPADAVVVDTIDPPRPRPRNTTRSANAGHTEVPVPKLPPTVDSAINTPITPSQPTEEPPQRYVPTPPPPIDRDGTINPFRRGSSSR